jgi:glutamine cyclotransferase
MIKRACSSRFILLAFPAVLLLAAMLFASQGSSPFVETDSIPVLGYQIVNTYPHSNFAFTQGLVYDEGVLYEGTGLYGRSSLRRVDLETGRVLKQTNLESTLFGEGVALWKDRIIQLTWQSGRGLIYCKENLTDRKLQLPDRGLGHNLRQQEPDHERWHRRPAYS